MTGGGGELVITLVGARGAQPEPDKNRQRSHDSYEVVVLPVHGHSPRKKQCESIRDWGDNRT
jgi:hypothetical protein